MISRNGRVGGTTEGLRAELGAVHLDHALGHVHASSRFAAVATCRDTTVCTARIGCSLTCRCAHRDLERQLDQAAAAAAAAVAGRAAAGRRLPAGDQARRRQARRAPRRRARAARLRRSRRTARRPGTAWRSSRASGWTTSSRDCRAARASRIRRRARWLRRARGVRVVSVYVPNGRTPDSDHYRYKLAWLASLRERARGRPGGDGRVRRHEHRADR